MDNNLEKKEGILNNLPFLDHLEELRHRIIRIILSFIIFTVAAYIFKDDILQLLMEPVKDLDVKFIHLKIYDFFMAYLKISLYTGIVFSIPVIIFQISQFILPALFSTERKWYYSGIAFFVIFFFTGSFFSYRYLAPISADFMISITKSQNVPEEIKMERFQTEILDKLPNKRISDYLLARYEKDFEKKIYTLKDGLSSKEKSRIVEILASVQYSESRDHAKNDSSKIQEIKRLKAIEEKLDQINNHLKTLIKKQENQPNPSDNSLELTRQFADFLEVNRGIYNDFQRKLNYISTLTDPFKGMDESKKQIVESHLSIADYLDWIVFIVIIIGIVFQLPLVITLLAKIGIVTDRSLTKFRPYALVIILVIAAIITPPDAITQVMVGGPVYLLYEVSILMARLMRKMNERKAKENEVKE